MPAPARPPAPSSPRPATVLALISLGGGTGALLRWAANVETTGFGWATWTVNITGCLAIGVVMTLVDGPQLRPFLTVGVLGGFTTFSTYLAEALTTDQPYIALTYLCATPAAAVVCTALAVHLTRRWART